MKILLKLIILIVIICNFVTSTNVLKYNKIAVNKFECYGENPKYCSQLNCTITNNKNGSSSINVTCDLQNYIKDIMVYIQLYKKSRTMYKYKQFVVNMAGDYCATQTDNTSKNHWIYIIKENFLKYTTNLEINCPISPNLISVNDFPMVGKQISQLMPPGDYRLDIKISDKQNITTYFYGKIYSTVTGLDLSIL